MSTVSTDRPARPPADEPDPFYYGWREVLVRQPDGTEALEQIPLTLEDVLFPEMEDFIVQSDLHGSDRNYLKDVFNVRLAGDPRAWAVSCRVDWNLPGVRPLGPDVTVFFDLNRKAWATLDVAAEGARPAMVVEVTTHRTRENDLGVKLDFYHRAGVPLYVTADVGQVDQQARHLELIAYRHAPAGYERIAPDARGWIWLDPVGLWLGVVQDPEVGCDRVACFDGETGEKIRDYLAMSRALKAATAARAEAEARRAEGEARAQAEARIRDLEEAIRRLGQYP